MRLLPLLAAAPLCSSFTPCNPSISRSPIELRATPNDMLENTGKAAGSALLGLTLAFATINAPPAAQPANAAIFPAESSSITLSAKKLSSAAPKSEDDIVLEELTKETRAVEKEAKIDAKKARVEKSREAFYEYEAKMAQVTEDRIESEERRAELEYEKDKAKAEELMVLEKKAEMDAENASLSKEEKAAKKKEAKALLAKEKEYERKEMKAQKLEKIFLAEEEQEKKILAKKVAAERAEEARFEKVEKEYEEEVELAKEDEVELSLFKDLSQKKR